MDNGSMIYTEIVPYNDFTIAESCHHKHGLQQFPAFQDELKQIYTSPDEYVASSGPREWVFWGVKAPMMCC
jgi:hypothetical protein